MPRPADGWLFTFTHGCGQLWLWFNGCGAGWLWKSPAVNTSTTHLLFVKISTESGKVINCGSREMALGAVEFQRGTPNF